MYWKLLVMIGVMMTFMPVFACSRYQVIPDDLRDRVNRNVTFDELKAAPAKYQGELVILGGEVLTAKRLKDKTRIEILQLPLTDELAPRPERPQSKGRFVAWDGGTETVDPAVLEEGMPVTIIGEVQPPHPDSSEERDHLVPTLAIRDMTVWEAKSMLVQPYPITGYHYGAGYRPYHYMSGSRVVR